MTTDSSITTTIPSGFRQIGQHIQGQLPQAADNVLLAPAQFGSAVALSDSGNRMAVGSSNFGTVGAGAVFFYQRQENWGLEDVAADSQWQLLWQIEGEPGDRIGERLSLWSDDNDKDKDNNNYDGDLVAIRRNNPWSGESTAEVYRTPPLQNNNGVSSSSSSTTTPTLMGGSISTCNGSAIKLATTPANSVFGKVHWLLVSCEGFDARRGKVDILRFDQHYNRWTLFTTLEGANRGDRFGWATGVFVNNNNFLQVAVSSPYSNGYRGMVQVFNIDPQRSVSQVGSAIIGDAPKDLFGYALEMGASSDKPRFVVGAPLCSGGGVKRGCVNVYTWKRGVLEFELDWNVIGDTYTGIDEEDQFGLTVAMSKDGTRIASSSYYHNQQTGLVRLYERDGSKWVTLGDFTGETSIDRFGGSISLNGAGSVFAAGSELWANAAGESVGQVKVYLDDTPFCGLATGASDNDTFLARRMCRDDGSVVTSAFGCLMTRHPSGFCQWFEDLATRRPSASPTAAPFAAPSGFASVAPTFNPHQSNFLRRGGSNMAPSFLTILPWGISAFLFFLVLVLLAKLYCQKGSAKTSEEKANSEDKSSNESE